MNKYGILAVLALFIWLAGDMIYDNVAGETRDVAVLREEPNVYAVDDNGEEIEVVSYFYAVETYDKVLVPLVYVSEVITDEDIEQFITLSETIISQMDFDEIERGVDMVMLNANRNRQYPVFIEVIRVTE